LRSTGSHLDGRSHADETVAVSRDATQECARWILAIHLDEDLRYPDMAAARESYAWMLPDLDPAEEKKLERYLRSVCITHEDGSVTVHRRIHPVWAFITWEPHPA